MNVHDAAVAQLAEHWLTQQSGRSQPVESSERQQDQKASVPERSSAIFQSGQAKLPPSREIHTSSQIRQRLVDDLFSIWEGDDLTVVADF
jgi:hypothetical protein